MVAATGFANYLNARNVSGGDVGAVRTRGDRIGPGQNLSRDEQLVSPKGRLKLWFQKDGNLVLYGDGRRLWDAGSTGRGSKVALQRDGNLVIYQGGSPIWASDTSGRAPGFLVVQDDGNLVLYGPGGHGVLWHSGTHGFTPYDGRSWFEKTAATVGQAVSTVASIAGSVVSVVPGIGTVAGGVLGAVAAVGRGESIADIAIGAARGALPGGAVAQAAFDVAVGIAKGENVTGVALGALRNQIPGGDVGKAAFDAGLAVVYHAKPAEAARAAAQLPTAKARATFAKPVIAAAKVRAAKPRLVLKAMRTARARTRARPVSQRARVFLGHALKTKSGVRLRDTRGLSPDGLTYIVEKNDSAWRIAQNLTGDGNKHVFELFRANSPPKTIVRNGMSLAAGTQYRSGDNFKFLSVGEKIKIPKAWLGVFVNKTAQAPPPAPGAAMVSLPAPEKVAVSQPAPAVPVSTSPVAVIPKVAVAPLPSIVDPLKLPPSNERDDPAAIAQAKTILVAWEHTDGVAAAGLPDYGGNPADQSPIWGGRDSWELRAFVVWSNAHGTALSLLGDLTQAKLDALVAWAENRAKQIATGEGAVSPTGIPVVAPPGQIVAVGPSPIPVSAGPSTLPPGALPQVVQAGVIPTELIPETNISGSPDKKGGAGFGFGIAALALLGVGIAFSESDRRKRSAA